MKLLKVHKKIWWRMLGSVRADRTAVAMGHEHVVKQPQASPSTQLGLDRSMLWSSPPCFCCDDLLFFS
jgi:hypothetical protein